MLVSEVLDLKGRRVVTIDPEATVEQAAARLVQNDVGSLPVVDAEGKLVGVLSERDVLRLAHHRGEGFGRLLVSDVMTCNPSTCRVDDSVDEVMGLMSERRIAKVPVLEAGSLVGVISVGDVVKLMYDKVSSENRHLMSYIHGDL
ncbi:CBS domain-containing protein [Planctomyces sp. SH-PL62]|uniref:CBS domain-containing protein n=1 Tax=Planctomyces sp. SH-PL62 TaxID=1636152 RepID=UPI00078DA812|nr:CBS domain-containing protein [Planctomyces sp. SH-PL62]AMV39705.1 Inosine-5'-monophosphate dehydrogenase [Planctomyces sp. SH-PL62]